MAIASTRNKGWMLKICASTGEQMHLLFAFVLLFTQMVFVISEHWLPKAVL